MSTDLAELADLWAEAEGHMQAVVTYARRTVIAAWLAGDALLRIKNQLPHGQWTPALKGRGIAPRTARRFIELRQKHDQIGQVGRFASVSAALLGPVGPATEPAELPKQRYVIAADDFWDWEWDVLSPLAKKHLSEAEQQVLEGAIGDVRWEFERDFEEGPAFETAWATFRQALTCFVDVGPLEGDAAAAAESERRLAAFLRCRN